MSVARAVPLVLMLVSFRSVPGAAQTVEVTLAEAILRSERTQPRVAQAVSGVRSAEARVRTARGAYLPNLTASSQGSETASGAPSRIDQNTGQVIQGGNSNRSFSANLSTSVDLFTGFRRGADVKAARASSAASSAQLVDAKYQQALATTNQFFDALAAQELVRVRQASVTRAEEQKKIAIAKLRTGTATRSDSLRALVTLGSAQLQLIQAESQLTGAEAGLARLIGERGRARAKDEPAFHEVRAELDTVSLRSEAVAAAPQVESARSGEEAASASVKAARAGYWPTLSLSAGTGWSGSRSTNYDFFNQRNLSLGLNWSIFNRYNREQQIEIQEANLEVAKATAADAVRQVDATLTAQLAELDAARARIGITQTSVTAATEDLRVQQERYRLGASTILDVLTSQEALTQAEVNVITARFDYLRAKARIEALIGRSL